MPGLNIEEVVQQMMVAASGVLKAKWPEVQNYAQSEFKKIAQTVALIIAEKAKGTVTEDEAVILLDMQKQASRTVLITSEGLGVLAAEEAINAALDSVKGIVNSAVGWTIL
jgi:hypothetical protein